MDDHRRRAARVLVTAAIVLVNAVVSTESLPDDLKPTTKRASGSAFIVGKTGHLITNVHVIATCKNPSYRSGASSWPVQVVRADPAIDLAILFSEALVNTSGLDLRTDIKLGEPVTVFGYPLAKGLAEKGRATVGVVLGLSSDGRRLMTNAQVQAGNSGGPIFDQSGHVVGVAFGKNVNRTFAISAAAINETFESAGIHPRLSNGGRVRPVADIIDAARLSTGKIECE